MCRGYYKGDPFFIFKVVKIYKSNLKWVNSNQSYIAENWRLMNCKFGIGKEVSPYAYCIIKDGDQTIYRSSVLNQMPMYRQSQGENLYELYNPNIQLKGIETDWGANITVLYYNPKIFELNRSKEYNIEIYSLIF